ncbi:MAG TPA: DMT family transporter [Candidatus Bathyarchaeia archaeon]|nr:DMT family transporter [Candidatus Bathyarchaeia archaeon]
MPKRNRSLALLEGAVAGALFGTAAIFIRLLPGVNVFSIAFWRLVIASSVFVAIIAISKRGFRWSPIREEVGRVAILGTLLGLHFILFVSAVMDTSIINATVLVNTTSIWSMFVSSLIFKLKPSRAVMLGIMVSFLGVIIITYGDAAPGAWSLQLKGDLEAVLAAVVEAFYLNYGRETRKKSQIIPLMLAIYVFSALTVLVIGLGTNQSFSFPLQWTQIVPLIGLGILPTAMAHSFYFSSLSHLKSFETAAMALLEPIGATLLGIFIFALVPKPIFILGAALVLAGIVAVAMKE